VNPPPGDEPLVYSVVETHPFDFAVPPGAETQPAGNTPPAGTGSDTPVPPLMFPIVNPPPGTAPLNYTTVEVRPFDFPDPPTVPWESASSTGTVSLPLLWTDSSAHPDPTAVAPGSEPSSTPSGDPNGKSFSRVLALWSDPTSRVHWLLPDGTAAFPTADAWAPAPMSFEISKTDFETVYTGLGGTLAQADLLFAKLDQDADGSIDKADLLAGAKNAAPALTATNGPAAPAGLAAPETPGNELGAQTLLGNPPLFTVK
jgi:hypothetical protein